MRRFAMAFLAIPMVFLIGVVPVAADVPPFGTNFFSGLTSCSTSGDLQVCTDTNLSTFSNEDGSDGPVCVAISVYSFSSADEFTSISDESGCVAPGALTVGKHLSVVLAPTDFALSTCDSVGSCASRTVTVSASDRPTGHIAKTTTHSKEKVGRCTIHTTTVEKYADLAGTLTIDGTTIDETGFVDVKTLSTKTNRC